LRYLKQSVLLITIITLMACTTVNTFINDNDYTGLQAFCEQKETAEEREACFYKAAKSAEKEHPGMAYKLYMKLGDDTKKSAYYNRAGEIARSIMHLNSKMTERAVIAFEAAGNDEGVIEAVIEQSSRMIWGKKDLPWDLVKETADKYKIKEVYENLAIMAMSKNADQENHKLSAAENYEKAGMKEESKKLYFEVAQLNIKKKYYHSAARAYEAGGDKKSAVKYWLKAADKDLKARNPQYESAMSFYEKAGKAEEGKRRVAKQMIEKLYKPTMKEGLKIAESVSPEFYKEALILAGTLYFSKNSYTAADWFKAAGVDDAYGQMGEVFLAISSPDFQRAEKYFLKSENRNYEQLILKRAVEVENNKYILKYSGAATSKELHERVGYALLEAEKFNDAYAHFQKSGVEKGALIIAEKAAGSVNKLLTPQFYYIGGERKKGIQLWKEAVEWVIETKQFLQSYLSLFAPPEELMDIYWKEILEYYRAKDNIMAMAPLRLLEIDRPVLALGFIHNAHRLDYLNEMVGTVIKTGGSSVYSRDMVKQLNYESSINAHFNTLLITIPKNKAFRASKYQNALEELEKAQIELLKRDFRQMKKHSEIAERELSI